MNPLKVIGAIYEEGNSKEDMCAIVPVTQMGDNVIHGNNHSDYVDCLEFYNIIRYLQDFKEKFPSLYHVGVGQFCPHTTKDVKF